MRIAITFFIYRHKSVELCKSIFILFSHLFWEAILGIEIAIADCQFELYFVCLIYEADYE